LLAISQTCRFQGKSFLKFLLPKETDVDSFRRTRPIRYSVAVGRKCGEVSAATTEQAHVPQPVQGGAAKEESMAADQ